MAEAQSQTNLPRWRTYLWALAGALACTAGTVHLVAGNISPWLPLGQVAFGVFAIAQSVHWIVTRRGT